MSDGRTGLLLGPDFARAYGGRIDAVESETGASFERILLPEDPAARLPPDDVARIELAYFSADVYPERSPGFFAATLGAPKLRWLHVFNVGVDHPVFGRFPERGVTLTSSPGATAVPIAQSAVAGLLSLARRFPLFARAQAERTWLDHRDLEHPPELSDQTLVVLGLGAIGSEIARLGRALGLHVVGIRRRDPGPDAPVDEWHPPAALADLLPRADWLAIACPLNDETRGLVGADALSRLPRGAYLLNVARGEIVDEAALVEALRGGRLAGAYLDVFEAEPLPADSPLWGLDDVIVTPHASHLSTAVPARLAEIFLDNLARFARGDPLRHVVS